MKLLLEMNLHNNNIRKIISSFTRVSIQICFPFVLLISQGATKAGKVTMVWPYGKKRPDENNIVQASQIIYLLVSLLLFYQFLAHLLCERETKYIHIMRIQYNGFDPNLERIQRNLWNYFFLFECLESPLMLFCCNDESCLFIP